MVDRLLDVGTSVILLAEPSEKTTRQLGTTSLVKRLMVEGKGPVDLLLSLVHCLFHRYVGT